MRGGGRGGDESSQGKWLRCAFRRKHADNSSRRNPEKFFFGRAGRENQVRSEFVLFSLKCLRSRGLSWNNIQDEREAKYFSGARYEPISCAHYTCGLRLHGRPLLFHALSVMTSPLCVMRPPKDRLLLFPRTKSLYMYYFIPVSPSGIFRKTPSSSPAINFCT